MTSLRPWTHPTLFARKAWGRLRRQMATVPKDQPVIREIGRGLRYEHTWLPFLDDDDLRAMLTGSYDIILCDFLKANLKPGDIMLDVGANVGYISAISASCVNKTGEVHGFEPLPECYARLEKLRSLNPDFRFFFNNVALGKEAGTLPISYNPDGDSRNASLVPGKDAPVAKTVPVRRLDEYIAENVSSPDRIRLIKIDVEGFEFPVLQGLEGFLKLHQPVIVCEVKPWELTKLGASKELFDRFMAGFGYRSHLITEADRQVKITDLDDMEVVVFRK